MLKIYENIKNLRIKNGWTQAELAEKIGYADKTMISKIENGKVDLQQSVIVRFAELFSVTPGDLMGWEDEENTKQPYYFDPETAAIAQDLKDNPGHRVLFDASRKLSPEAMEEVKNFIKFQIAKEEPWRDE